MNLFEKHESILRDAIAALHARTFFAAFPENPAPAQYGESADSDGKEKFQAQLGKKFEELNQPGAESWIGHEVSPYTQDALEVTYPALPVEVLVERAGEAFGTWRKISAQDRAGLLIESLMHIRERFFEIAYATMHTTGQGYMMAFQASGPHAADRALEAIATGFEELSRFPSKALWQKPLGKYDLQLEKEWRAVPKGISVVVGCSTFPTWNSVTGIFASLITGNTVIVKPHPGAILPIAIFVSEIRKVLSVNNINPNVCQLAPDTLEHMITRDLAEHPRVKLIDFTGNADFGGYLEGLPGKTVFTEKSGINSVILDGVEDVDKVAANLAFSINLYSGQMCTAPQNFYIPVGGIKSSSGLISFDEFAQKLVDNVNSLIDNPKAGPFVLGAIQNKKTGDRVSETEKLPVRVWLKSRSFENPMFKNARVATPVILEVEASDRKLLGGELFGPIALLIKTKDTDESISLAQASALAKMVRYLVVPTRQIRLCGSKSQMPCLWPVHRCHLILRVGFT